MGRGCVATVTDGKTRGLIESYFNISHNSDYKTSDTVIIIILLILYVIIILG